MPKIIYKIIVVGFLLLSVGAGCARFSQKSSPDLAEKFYVTSQLLADDGEYNAALAELAKAVDACPDLAVAHSAIGDIHRLQGRLDQARRAYEVSCTINPYAFRPHYRLGVTYQDLADLRENIARAREYISRAVSTYLRAVTIDPMDYDANLNLSACYFELDNPGLAEQYCRAAIRCDSAKRDAYINLGIILDAQEKQYEAIKVYRRALEFEGEKYYILMDLADVYVRQKRLAGAILIYAEALKEKPQNPRPMEKTGQCHLLNKEYLKAMEAFEAALKIAPKRPHSHHGIGAVYMSLFLRNPDNATLRDQALGAWNHSLELEPNQPDLIRLVKKYTPTSSGTGL